MLSQRQRALHLLPGGRPMTALRTASKRWDPLVRLTHWGIAAAVVANGVLSEEGSAAHVWIGYAAAALLSVRLVWGVVGTRSARFSAFPPSPRAAVRHIGDMAKGRHVEHRSHNPLGALMVYALWAALALVIASGIALDQDGSVGKHAIAASRSSVGAHFEERHDEHSDEGQEGGAGEMIEEVHEIAANLLFLLAALHVAGVAFESRRVGGGLVGAMITGRGKSRPAGG